MKVWQRKEMKLNNWYYKTYLAHRCLYYKHCMPILSDTDFDFFEMQVFKIVGDIEMVDWEPRLLRTAGSIDRLTLEQVKELANTPKPEGQIR